MGYKAFASMNIAIIGNGRTTATLAQGLAIAGHEIFIGIKEDQSIILDFLEEEFENIHVVTMEQAANYADLVIMATPPEEVREAAYLLDDVRKKVIIDNTFMSYSGSENYLNTLTAIRAITGSPFVVKCFNAAGFAPMPQIVQTDSTVNMFVAGDNQKAKELAKLIARDMGYSECHDFGGSESVSLLDEMAICYYNLSTEEQREKAAVKVSRK